MTENYGEVLDYNVFNNLLEEFSKISPHVLPITVYEVKNAFSYFFYNDPSKEFNVNEVIVEWKRDK